MFATTQEALDAIVANAKTTGDKKAERRATNLKSALERLRPSDLNHISCGKDLATTNFPVDQQKDIIGELLGKGLEKYLPTLAAALASAPTAGLVTFLTPEKIGSDSVEMLNNSNKFTRDEVSNAARQMLQAVVERRPQATVCLDPSVQLRPMLRPPLETLLPGRLRACFRPDHPFALASS